MKKILLSSLFAIAASGLCQAEQSQETTFLFNFYQGAERWLLMLPAPTKDHAFEAAESALDILSVTADGKEVAPEVRVVAGNPLHHAVPSNGVVVFYRFRSDSVFSLVDFDEPVPGNRNVRFFHIPEASSRIQFVYVVRYPDGSRSGTIRATYLASHFELHRLTVGSEPDRK